jgi:hypothetical protein
MKHIVIEIDGIRHQVVKNAKPNHDYCDKEQCSLFKFCQTAPGAPCVVVAPTGYHFELEGHASEVNESTPMKS